MKKDKIEAEIAEQELAKKRPVYIPKQGKRFKGSVAHLRAFTKTLKEGGIDGWNTWKIKKVNEEIDLRGIMLAGLDLSGINLSVAHLEGARFNKIDFRGANFYETSLKKAVIHDSNFDAAVLTGCFFNHSAITTSSMVQANLILAHFNGAKLEGINLAYADCSGADLSGAALRNAKVTGVNTWEIITDENTVQEKLILDSWFDPLMELSDDTKRLVDIVIETNDIEVAQLLYLVKRRTKGKSEKLRNVINALTEKIVLILGNFSRREKAMLNEIREKLADKGYVPIIFDFTAPRDRDLIETVAVLAGLSRFVIADFTSPSSTPLEALLVISGFGVPFAPIMFEGKRKRIFGMFQPLKDKYEWVLDPWYYKDKNHLIKNLDRKVIARCDAMRLTIDGKRGVVKK
jgi:hypothetical protein